VEQKGVVYKTKKVFLKKKVVLRQATEMWREGDRGLERKGKFTEQNGQF